jgi:hypothetical protein
MYFLGETNFARKDIGKSATPVNEIFIDVHKYMNPDLAACARKLADIL